jgi:hypothetical protein
MKNKSYLTLLMIIAMVAFASCSGSRGGYGRKGYGCPATASISQPLIEINKI